MHNLVTIQLFFLLIFMGKNLFFHQIRGFKVILLWITMHEINKKGEFPREGTKPGILFFVVSKPVRYYFSTLFHVNYRLICRIIYVYIFSSLHLEFFIVLNVCSFFHNRRNINGLLSMNAPCWF